MDYLEQQVPIIRDGWDRLSFHHHGVTITIPDAVMLDELIRSPQPYKIRPLLLIHKTSKRRLEDVIKIIDDKQKQPSWKLITKALKGTRSERLYIVSSQNAYRIPPSSDLVSQEAELESQKVLQYASNTIINHLRHKFNYLSESDQQAKEICDKHGYFFEIYRFTQMVQRYCEFILPYPCKTRFNREYNLHVDLNKAINLYGDKEKEIVRQGIAHSQKLMERFSLYRYATAVQDRIFGLMNLDEKKVFDSHLFDKTDDLYTSNRKIARDQQKAKRQELNGILLSPRVELHQCVFCYRFRFAELPPQGNPFPQHCDRDECKLAYGRWSRHVRRERKVVD
jgi:hypothetical protein